MAKNEVTGALASGHRLQATLKAHRVVKVEGAVSDGVIVLEGVEGLRTMKCRDVKYPRLVNVRRESRFSPD